MIRHARLCVMKRFFSTMDSVVNGVDYFVTVVGFESFYYASHSALTVASDAPLGTSDFDTHKRDTVNIKE